AARWLVFRLRHAFVWHDGLFSVFGMLSCGTEAKIGKKSGSRAARRLYFSPTCPNIRYPRSGVPLPSF
ncbi:MAG: hypothetical protein RR382_01070, partial [Tannerellaceae bacterium]